MGDDLGRKAALEQLTETVLENIRQATETPVAEAILATSDALETLGYIRADRVAALLRAADKFVENSGCRFHRGHAEYRYDYHAFELAAAHELYLDAAAAMRPLLPVPGTNQGSR